MYKRVFDIHAWKLSTHAFNEGDIRLYESLTSIGNGYMGMRGNFEEGFSGNSHTGTYIAGIWFPDKTRVGWWKNGYPKYFGKVINAVNFAAIGVEINGKTVDLHTSNFSDYYEELDMRSGLLTRSYTVDSVKLTFRRFFSIVERRTAEFQLIIEGKANVKLTSAIDGNVKNLDSNYDERFWDIVDGTENYLSMRTKENPFGTPRFTVSAGMKNTLSVKAKRYSGVGSGYVYECFDFGLGEGEKVVFEKSVAVITDRDTVASSHKALTLKLLSGSEGFEKKLTAQTEAWKKRWDKCDVTASGDDEAQQGIRFNIFQLFSTYYGEDERLNIGPKGFTGEKYGGATYWDTEAFILPIELRNSPLGHPSEPNYINNMKLEKAANKLLEQDVACIKKALKDGNFSDADVKTHALCTAFRNMIEYGVEQNLLSGVVSRFSRNVSTMKIPCLNAITKEDIALFDKMMTKYSYYDHSHSIETPLPPPDIADVEKDLIQMRDWAKNFSKRCEAEQDKAKGK